MADKQLQADEAFRRRDLAAAAMFMREHLALHPQDLHAWMKLAAICRAANTPVQSIEAVDRALAIDPLFYLALLMKASLVEGMQQPDAAAELYAAAIFHRPAGDVPHAVQKQLEYGKAYIANRAAGVEDAVRRLATQAGVTGEDANIKAFIDTTYRRRPLYRQEPTHYRWPGLPDTPFFDTYDPPWLAELEGMTEIIQAEFEAAYSDRASGAAPYVSFDQSTPVGPWGALNHSRDWSAIHLIRHGSVNPVAAQFCPSTMDFFTRAGKDRQPDIAGLTPNLMFSILAPHTHIPPHHGVANFRAVLHLPLIVPEPCRFRVGAEERAWQRGKAWVFDDTIEHEAWNDSDLPRVILIADVWRPEITAASRQAIRICLEAMTIASDIGAL